jgi:hypothetical protein
LGEFLSSPSIYFYTNINRETMAKATKTWKIGEYMQGGVLTIEINGDRIDVVGKEWNFSKGSNKSSDQSGAKEFTRKTFTTNSEFEILDFLEDLSTSYYADEVMKWIKTKVEFKGEFNW